MIPRSVSFGLALAVSLLSSGFVSAGGNLQKELGAAAKDIKKLLDGRNETAVAVGQFTGPAHLPTSAGPAISKLLIEELKTAGISVNLRANLSIEGRYRDAKDKETGLLVAQLKLKVVTRQDEILVEFDRGIFGDASISTLFGLTVELPPSADAKTRSKKLEQAIDNPNANIENTIISSGKNSPYAIEVLVKSNGDSHPGTPRGGELKEGLPFVPIRRGEVYEIKLINKSEHDAAVTLSIDGLSMYTFSDIRDNKGQPSYAVVFIPAKKSAVISGWHRTNEKSEEFLVTEYAKSAAAELKSTANLGTITATFAAAWPTGGKPPADEPKNPNEFARSGDATGRGSMIEKKYVEVTRFIGVVRTSISVRYAK